MPSPRDWSAINTTRIDSEREPVSLPNYVDLARDNRPFDSMAALFQWSANLTGGDEAERLQALRVTGNFFETLGARPLLGRLISANDGEGGGLLSAATARRQELAVRTALGASRRHLLRDS